MRATLAAVAGAALVVGATVGPTPRALAEPIDWSMELRIADTWWSSLITTNFLGCADLPIQLTVETGGGVGPDAEWSLVGEITAADSSTVLETFTAQGVGNAAESIPGVQMCEHFGGAVTPPDHEYVATATATVPDSSVPEQELVTRFTIEPLSSHVMWGAHELTGGVSAIHGTARVSTTDGFFRPAPAALVTLERLEGATWVTVGQATSATDGSVVIVADRLLPAGTYTRFSYPGSYWVAPYTGMPWELGAAWSPPPPIPPVATPAPTPTPPVAGVPPTARVKVRAVSSRSKLKVDVNPNVGRKYWTFQVQRRNADGTWIALKTYRTRGSSEKRTINLPKGTYRVWVNPKFNRLGVMSAEVTLKR